MKEIKYCKVNAFTSINSLGNPAAYLYYENIQLSDEEMLLIAKEHKGFVSEMIYVEKKQNGYFLKYYSSECEVAFCGHGTIACMYDLLKSNNDVSEMIEIETNKKGKLVVYNCISNEDSVYITAPDPIFIKEPIILDELLIALSIESADISNKYSMDIIDAGLRTLIIPIKELRNEISIFPNEHTLKEYCVKNEIDIILIFSTETHLKSNAFHTRVFAPRFGYLEDPATGSGNSAFGYYLLKNELWNGENISIEQGNKNMVFNEIKLKLKNNKVLFGGKARKTIEGKYILGNC